MFMAVSEIWGKLSDLDGLGSCRYTVNIVVKKKGRKEMKKGSKEGRKEGRNAYANN